VAYSTKKSKYGFKPDERKPEDYIFGASSLSTEVIRPDGDWTAFLPEKEYQKLNGVESYACVIFTTLNCIEALIKAKYGLDRNYSDRFLAAVSGTKEGGNSPQTVAEFLRKVGVVTQEEWPYDKSIKTFEKFYEPLPPKLYELAQEFITEWDFKHEYVDSDIFSIQEALKCSPLGIAVSAWYRRGGKYYKPAGKRDNHYTTLFAIKEGEYLRVFDTYDSTIKDIEWGTKPSAIKRFYIEKRKNAPPHDPVKMGLLTKLLTQLNILYQELRKMIKEEKKEKPKTNAEKLYETALSFIGTDASPNDEAPDELGCAETVNAIHKKCFGDYIGGDVSTYRLFQSIKERKDFTLVDMPEAGDIIISPTGYGNGVVKNGHAGFVMKDGKIASNDSGSGLFKENYTLATWNKRYAQLGGYPVYFYRKM